MRDPSHKASCSAWHEVACKDNVRVASTRIYCFSESIKDMRARAALSRRAPSCAKAVRVESSEALGVNVGCVLEAESVAFRSFLVWGRFSIEARYL